MKRIKYIKISNKIKVRYLTNNLKKNPYVVFLHGFMSDIEGEKPKTIRRLCSKLKIGFIAIEYSGHGKSSGKFTDGNITKWSNQVSFLIQKKLKNKKIILVGSSMGSWISALQFKKFEKQIKGFIGIGSAPEFLEQVMWKNFTKKMKNETIKKGIYHLKHGGFEYPITYQLIKDGRKNKVLNKKINLKIPVSLFHGSKDDTVPTKYSRELIKVFSKAKKKLFVIKNGDHSLFNNAQKKLILKELKNILKLAS